MLRALLFALTGVAFFAYWAIARPSSEITASMQEWPTVLGFSATLLTLALALAAFGRMVGGPTVIRLATIAGAAMMLSSVSNVFEDGFRIEWMFVVFILGSLILVVALLALAVVIARTRQGGSRLLALIPLGTVAGMLLFVAAGGPIMLATWLAATGVALMVAPARIAATEISTP